LHVGKISVSDVLAREAPDFYANVITLVMVFTRSFESDIQPFVFTIFTDVMTPLSVDVTCEINEKLGFGHGDPFGIEIIT
jgi:hypothetical protein